MPDELRKSAMQSYQDASNMAAGGFAWVDPKKPTPSPPSTDCAFVRGVAAFADALRMVGAKAMPVIVIENWEDWRTLAEAAPAYWRNSQGEIQIDGIVFRYRARAALVPEFYK